MAREAKNMILDLADKGYISYRELVKMLLNWMSDDDVADMLISNGFVLEDKE